jgi:glucan biosynthesis protein C
MRGAASEIVDAAVAEDLSAGAIAGSRTEPLGVGRLGYLDDLKVAMTIGVIVAHAGMSYGADGSWFYAERGPDVLRIALDVLLAVGSLFCMGVFFFLAGAFVPGSLARKGPRRFLAERWLRLGVPLAVFVLGVVPAVVWWVAGATHGDVSAAKVWRDQLRALDAGPLWFVGVLLLFSTAAAVVRRPLGGEPLRDRTLVLTAAGIAVASFVLRLRWRIDSDQVLAAHLWQWGQCAGLFLLGLHAGRHGWLTRIPARSRSICVRVAGAGALGVVALLLAFRSDTDPLGGGAHWQSGVVAVLEGAVSVSAAIVLTDVFRSRARGRWAPTMARSAYAAFILQTPVLVGLALLARRLPVGASARFAIVAPSAIALCFAGAALLLRCTPVARVL